MGEYFSKIEKEILSKLWKNLSIFCRYQKNGFCTIVRAGITKKTCEFDNCSIWPKEI